MNEFKQEDKYPEKRGKLKIFLGYATGVGKTYTMLTSAQHLRKEGRDVVIGYIETPNSTDTSTLLKDLEEIPCCKITHQGNTCLEMNTDAILTRHPEFILIDELSHTNAIGLRHTHRYQDVLEILNSGINVYTTINIQHLESLNDVVSRITGVVVQETVPDHVLDGAHEIELVDLSVEELLARLNAGKVYIPEHIQKTQGKFLRPGNLMALREMALRRAAECVDEQMRQYMQTHAISGTWPVGERLLVCIGPSPLSERLVRTTRRLAWQLDAEWIAAYVETPGHTHLPPKDEERVSRTMGLAQELGAQTVRLSGRSVAETLADYALSRNVTKIVAGKPLRPRWKEWWHGSIIDQILRHSQDIDVYVISGKVEQPHHTQTTWLSLIKKNVPWQSYLLSAGLVLLITVLGFPLRAFVTPTNLVMFYLAVVMLVAVWLGHRPAIMASLLSVIVFDVIFVPPYYTFVVSDAEYILTFVGLLAVGLVISTLTARAQEQALTAHQRETQTSALYELSQRLASTSNLTDIAQTTVQHFQATFSSPTGLFLADETGKQLILQASTYSFAIEAEAYKVAHWVFQHGKPAGHYADTLTHMDCYYFPLKSSGQVVGVIAIEFLGDYKHFRVSEQNYLLTSFSSQVALALEKAHLAEQAQRTQLLEETEKLQTTLLNSISHDLRTPLASITGVLSSLLDDADLLTPEAQHDLVNNAWEQALRLNRLVGNLLDMTRLESGALKVLCQPYDVEELVGTTLSHMPNRLQGCMINRVIPSDLPPMFIDLTLMVQALMNLVDNAIKYAPLDKPIEIEAYREQDTIIVAVKDRGPGLPEAELEHIFSKFFRLDSSGIGGIGLGLSIAHGIVEAHNGRIEARNRPDGGAIFLMALPIFQTDGI